MTEDQRIALLREHIRDVPDFPKPGIMFKDITPLLAHPRAFAAAIELMGEQWRGERIDAIIGIESRGFLFGAPLAIHMQVGFVPVRKPGKLPYLRDRVEYALEYGTDALEMHKNSLVTGVRVLIVDDVIATGGTVLAAIDLARLQGAHIAGAAFAIDLSFLGGAKRLAPVPFSALLTY